MIHVEREGRGALVNINGSGDEIVSEVAWAISSVVGRGREMCDGKNEDVKHALAQHVFWEIVKRSAVAIVLQYGVNVLRDDDDCEDDPDEAEFDGGAFANGLPADALKCFMRCMKGEF